MHLTRWATLLHSVEENADARHRHTRPDQGRFEAVKDDPSFNESRGLWERGQPPVEMIQAMCLRPEICVRLRALAGTCTPAGC